MFYGNLLAVSSTAGFLSRGHSCPELTQLLTHNYFYPVNGSLKLPWGLQGARSEASKQPEYQDWAPQGYSSSGPKPCPVVYRPFESLLQGWKGPRRLLHKPGATSLFETTVCSPGTKGRPRWGWGYPRAHGDEGDRAENPLPRCY